MHCALSSGSVTSYIASIALIVSVDYANERLIVDRMRKGRAGRFATSRSVAVQQRSHARMSDYFANAFVPSVELYRVCHTLVETGPASTFLLAIHFDAALRTISWYRATNVLKNDRGLS